MLRKYFRCWKTLKNVGNCDYVREAWSNDAKTPFYHFLSYPYRVADDRQRCRSHPTTGWCCPEIDVGYRRTDENERMKTIIIKKENLNRATVLWCETVPPPSVVMVDIRPVLFRNGRHSSAERYRRKLYDNLNKYALWKQKKPNLAFNTKETDGSIVKRKWIHTQKLHNTRY